MGEPSVGKSFSLNHLVDTSFGESTTQTTGPFFKWPFFRTRRVMAYLEGLWMSVSPTDDALIVALEFEGELNNPCHRSPDTI
jgi:hypothetical protein